MIDSIYSKFEGGLAYMNSVTTSTVAIVSSTFTNMTSAANGAAIWAKGATTVTLSTSIFS